MSRVLFVCVANSGRSVMAERLLPPGRRRPPRRPLGRLRPGRGRAPESCSRRCAELGIDASDHVPRRLDDEAVALGGRRRRDLRRRMPGRPRQALRQLAAPRPEEPAARAGQADPRRHRRPRRGAGRRPLSRRPARATLPRSALLAQLVEHLHGKEGVDGSSPSEGFAKRPANRLFRVSVHPGEGSSVRAANLGVWSGWRPRRFLMVIVRGLSRCCCGWASWSRRTSGLRLGWPNSSGG